MRASITCSLYAALLFVCAAFCCHAQNRFPPINLYAGDPTGNSCVPPLLQQSSTTGQVYYCNPNTNEMTGSGGSGCTISGSEYQLVTINSAGSGCTPATVTANGPQLFVPELFGLQTTIPSNWISSALSALPSTGGIVTGGYSGDDPQTGAQTTSNNPFSLHLGSETLQTTAPLVLTGPNSSSTVGQNFIGAGADLTIVQPQSGFSGAAAFLLEPWDTDVLFRQASARHFTLDMTNVSNIPGISILSGSNSPPYIDIAERNQNGSAVTLGTSSNSGAGVTEGQTFIGLNLYAATPKQAPGFINSDANETTIIASKLLGTSLEGSQSGLYVTNPSVSASVGGEGLRTFALSVASYPTGILLDSQTSGSGSLNPDVPHSDTFIGTTVENDTTGFKLTGPDANDATFGNVIAFTTNPGNSTSTVVDVDYGYDNFILDRGLGGQSCAYNFTANSSYNFLLRPFAGTNLADFCDAGTGNVALGPYVGTLTEAGDGGSPKFDLWGASGGFPEYQLSRAGTTEAWFGLSDTLQTNGADISTDGGAYAFYFNPDGSMQFGQGGSGSGSALLNLNAGASGSSTIQFKQNSGAVGSFALNSTDDFVFTTVNDETLTFDHNGNVKLGSNIIIPATATEPYVGFLTYSGGSTPSATCSATVNNGAIAINATPVAYQCSNATGSYAWNSLGGSSITWPTSGDAVISNGTNSPAGVAPVNGDCMVGSGGSWVAGSCSGSGGISGSGTTNQATNFTSSSSVGSGFTDTAGTITSGDIAAYTSSGTIGNCTTTPCVNALGIFNSSTTWLASGEVSLNLDGTYTVTAGETVCNSSAGATGHPNGSTDCATGQRIGYVKTAASSVTTATVDIVRN